jgi:hypothetical protein
MKIRFKLLSTPSPINVWISQSLTWVCLYRCTSKLPRSVLQPLADQMANRLPVWKGKFMHWSGRLTLIKTTLVAISMYTTISTELPPSLRKSMEKIMKGFLWPGSEMMQGGMCLVAWSRVQRPLHLGGLGVTYLTLLG